MPRRISRYAVGGKPADCRKGPRHASFTYTTACRHSAGSVVLFLSLVPPRATFRPAVLALGLAATVPRFGHAEATRTFHAVPFAVLEPAASAARWLLGSGGPAGRDGTHRAGHATAAR